MLLLRSYGIADLCVGFCAPKVRKSGDQSQPVLQTHVIGLALFTALQHCCFVDLSTVGGRHERSRELESEVQPSSEHVAALPSGEERSRMPAGGMSDPERCETERLRCDWLKGQVSSDSSADYCNR
uniref:Uncharacterized protein n=1 Tax=Lygus hesperus TaxID=30085 RepID=A0A146L1T8_LYGHE